MAEKEYIERNNVISHKRPFTEFDEGGWSCKVQAVAVEDIQNIPAADVMPVRHGHWYNRGGRFRCSVCDNEALLKDIGGTGGWSHKYEQQKSPYCPNCGAKMDGNEVE